MRADERQAAVAYAYAWWMTGDDDAAATALRSAMAEAGPDGDDPEQTLVALTTAVRRHLGSLRPMPPASELALLHDGLGLPLRTSASLAGVPAAQAEDHLAHGRLEALLETVREDFRHPERLGGLAVGNPGDLDHAEQCRSCTRARTLFERGTRELRELSAVSAPAGLIASLVAENTPAPEVEQAPAETDVTDAAPPEAETPPAEAETPAEVETPAAFEEPTVVEAPAGDEMVDAPPAAGVDEAAPSVEELEAMLLRDDAPAADEADVEAPPDPGEDVDVIVVPEAPEAPEEVEPEEVEPGEGEPAEDDEALGLVPMTPGKRRAAGVLAVAGLITVCALVVAVVASGGMEDLPRLGEILDPASPAAEPTPAASQPAQPNASEPANGNNGNAGRGFSVEQVGLLLSGSEDMVASGTTIGPNDPIRIAVDYNNGTRGVELTAAWRAEDKPFRQLEAVVSSRASRHVWGVPVPPNGWPIGDHRIVVSADDQLAGAVDFTVE